MNKQYMLRCMCSILWFPDSTVWSVVGNVKYPVLSTAAATPPPKKKNPKHCFWKVVQWAWHISSHLWFGIGTVMASLREVSKEVLLSAVHTYCTLIYNAYLVICCATCDCSSSGFLLLLPYAFFPLIVFLPITCFCNFFFLLRRVKKNPFIVSARLPLPITFLFSHLLHLLFSSVPCHLFTPPPSSWALYFPLSSSLFFPHNVFLLSLPVTTCICYIHFLHETA